MALVLLSLLLILNRYIQVHPDLKIFRKLCVLKSFSKFTGKHLCRNHFLIKLQTYSVQLHWKSISVMRIFCEFCEFFKITVFTEYMYVFTEYIWTTACNFSLYQKNYFEYNLYFFRISSEIFVVFVHTTLTQELQIKRHSTTNSMVFFQARLLVLVRLPYKRWTRCK